MARIVLPFTAKQVKEARPRDRQYILFDGNGLQLCIYPTGRKVWRFDYHDTNKKRKTYAIGDAQYISLADARKLGKAFSLPHYSYYFPYVIII